MNKTLEQWVTNHWLLRHQAQSPAILNLLAVADRDLHDCQVSALSDDWRFSIAYNAGLQLCMAALNASGYEPAKGQSAHMRAIGSLPHTIGMSDAALDGFRKKRGASVYDSAGLISPTEVKEIIVAVKQLRQAVQLWLETNHLELLHPGLR